MAKLEEQNALANSVGTEAPSTLIRLVLKTHNFLCALASILQRSKTQMKTVPKVELFENASFGRGIRSLFKTVT